MRKRPDKARRWHRFQPWFEGLESRWVPHAIPILDSLPGAAAALYLDFDGHTEASWGEFQNVVIPAYNTDGDAADFSDAELNSITEIWKRVAEDYAPFNLNVTTAPPDEGPMLRVAIGGDGAWTGALNGGISYVGLFSDPVPDVVFVFSDNLGGGNARLVAESASHESGHGFGLDHQSLYDEDGNLVEEYNPGDFLRAPIMGIANDAARSIWWYGPTDDSPDSMQDDMEILAGAANGFGWRPDDVGDTVGDAEQLDAINQYVTGAGVIETMSDVDVWSFSTDDGFVMFQVSVPTGINNLDAKIQLLDADGNVVYSWQDSEVSCDALLVGNVSSGSYRLVVGSHGLYGDVGQYLVSGVILPPGSTLTPPTELAAVAVGPDQVELAWIDNADDESGYVVQRSLDGYWWESISELDVDSTSYVDLDLNPDTMYEYRVYAKSSLATSAWSNEASASTWPAKPAPPTDLQATAMTFDRIHLAWIDQADNETAYVVERALNGFDFTPIATLAANSTSFNDLGLDQSTTYLYRVHALNGITASELSNQVSKATLPQKPAAPSNLQVVGIGINAINLTWTDNAGVETYYVVERITNGGSWVGIAALPAGSTSYEDSGLGALTSYQYRVRAVNHGVDSGYSNVATGRTLPNPPVVPTGVKAATYSRTQMTLSWNDNSNNETYFKVMRSIDGVNWQPIGYTLANVRTLKVAKPPRGAVYYYSVVAVNQGGDSAASGFVAVKYNSVLVRAALGLGTITTVK